MANALGTLFNDIASAIREKTGDTTTMKPMEFANAIRSIRVGGGSAGDGVWNVVFTAGTREIAASETQGAVFTHNLGVMPDVIVIITYGDVEDNVIRCALVVSQYVKDTSPEMEYGTIVSQASGSCLMEGGYDTTGGTNAMVYEMMGGPTEVTKNSFKFGNSYHLLAERDYTYVVIGRTAA